MFEARLVVERGSFRDASSDWGMHRFLSVPSPGDRISVRREEKVSYLTVLCVHHQPLSMEREEPGQPTAHVVAKWTGEE